MNLSDLLEKLYNFAPLEISENETWDNSGIQIGFRSCDIKKVLLCIDITREVVNIAKAEAFDCIISHHPLIFKCIKAIDDATYKSGMIIELIQSSISVISLHTNLDTAKNGVSTALANRLNLINTELLAPIGNYQQALFGYGRIGNLKKEMSFEELITYTKDRLATSSLRHMGKPNKIIKKIAVCGGSGASFIDNAVKMEADAYITGDIGHHDAQEAFENGLNIIDAGHFDTEKHALYPLKAYIDEIALGKIYTEIYMDNPFKIK